MYSTLEEYKAKNLIKKDFNRNRNSENGNFSTKFSNAKTPLSLKQALSGFGFRCSVTSGISTQQKMPL